MPMSPYCGNGLMNAPQEIVRSLLLRGHLKGSHRAALRVHAGHHVADRSVLPSCVKPLQDDQQCALILGVEQILQLASSRAQATLARLCLHPVRMLFPPAERLLRVVVRELHLLAGLYDQFLAEVCGHLGICLHSSLAKELGGTLRRFRTMPSLIWTYWSDSGSEAGVCRFTIT